MRVTVLGSFRKDRDHLNGTREGFQEACVKIGEAIAIGGHRLIVANSHDEESAESSVLAGFQAHDPGKNYENCAQSRQSGLRAHFQAVVKSSAVILVGGADGTYAAGLSALRSRRLVIPVPVFGGSAAELHQEDHQVERIDQISNLDLSSAGWATELASAVTGTLASYPRILIIHGRGDSGSSLQEKIRDSQDIRGISEPTIMKLSGQGASTVPMVFENHADRVSAAIAIVTADDVGATARLDDNTHKNALDLKVERRARENVWVEVGWFWGRLGRDRIFLWQRDSVAIPSDLQGVSTTRAESLEQAWPSILAFLRRVREETPA